MNNFYTNEVISPPLDKLFSELNARRAQLSSNEDKVDAVVTSLFQFIRGDDLRKHDMAAFLAWLSTIIDHAFIEGEYMIKRSFLQLKECMEDAKLSSRYELPVRKFLEALFNKYTSTNDDQSKISVLLDSFMQITVPVIHWENRATVGPISPKATPFKSNTGNTTQQSVRRKSVHIKLENELNGHVWCSPVFFNVVFPTNNLETGTPVGLESRLRFSMN